MKTLNKVKLVVVGVFFVLAAFLACTRLQQSTPTAETERAAAPAGPIPITVSYNVPDELNKDGGGAPSATMQQAAAFAWQEFIALNWPAVPQTGGVVSGAFVRQRDVPDHNAKFGDPNYKGPLVWETFRNKVEVFPGNTGPPSQAVPHGYPSVTAGDDSYGYDDLPAYSYANPVPACDSPAPTETVWINLDETDQITLNSMYAGNAPAPVAGGKNSSPQLIRFLAKANRSQYTYVAKQGPLKNGKGGWWFTLPGDVVTATKAYLTNNQSSPPAGGSDLISVPYNTIEAKSGWRVLTEAESNSKRFQTATVRYYENAGPGGIPCYRQDTFGLVALHIIQKTGTAPYFIFATFEQADNILTSAGARVEDEDGRTPSLPPCPSGQTAPCPTTPKVDLTDTPDVNADQVPPQDVTPANAAFCTTPGSQIYYINNPESSGVPICTATSGGATCGAICINYRDNAIPQPVIDANKTAHDAIKAYNQQQGIADSTWLYYKLINVQYVPIDKTYAGVYNPNPIDPNTAQNPASYHLANIMVETNRTLQLFSGSLVSSGFTGANSDYASQFGEAPSGSTIIHQQVYYNGNRYNMGGCMGCHASQGQDQSGDFSVILARGGKQNSAPEPPTPLTPGAVTQIKIQRNRSLK